jgi:3-isopropylmalate/(R)-2-methylmalate dehydratase small subunit
MMEKFTTLSGIAAPLLEDDINTDQISPVLPNRQLNPNYADILFARVKLREDGSENPDFVLNKPQFRKSVILMTGKNFGCGSSREAAVWGLQAFGIRCLIGKSFADFFRENCLQNGVLPIGLGDAIADALAARITEADGTAPFTVDLGQQIIAGPGGPDIAFEMPPADRLRLLEGLDDIGLSLKHADEITAWEKRIAGQYPWLQNARDSRL